VGCANRERNRRGNGERNRMARAGKLRHLTPPSAERGFDPAEFNGRKPVSTSSRRA
jgi:hypothetical protein